MSVQFQSIDHKLLGTIFDDDNADYGHANDEGRHPFFQQQQQQQPRWSLSKEIL